MLTLTLTLTLMLMLMLMRNILAQAIDSMRRALALAADEQTQVHFCFVSFLLISAAPKNADKYMTVLMQYCYA